MTDRHAQQAYPLRMPEKLRAALEEEAKSQGRSLNAEIIARLEASMRGQSVGGLSKAAVEEIADLLAARLRDPKGPSI